MRKVKASVGERSENCQWTFAWGGNMKRLVHGMPVQVRSLEEILATLDGKGKCDGILFMPEMARFCGAVLNVHRRADKTCVEGYGMRRLGKAVFLEASRCGGEFHDGCERRCLLFWHERWLVPAPGAKPAAAHAPPAVPAQRFVTRDGERYICQSTELLAATKPLSRWAVAAFACDVWTGEVRLRDFLTLVWLTLRRRLSDGEEPNAILGENAHPTRGDLALAAGDIVRVKSAPEIARQLDPQGKNKGLGFVPTMLPAIGKQYEVAFPIRKMILEKTGKMIPLANTVVLKGIQCGGPCVANCPRSSDLYWRESWLERPVDKRAGRRPDGPRPEL
ncbi:hypothetical protein [Duganella sp. LjRoot269]|uniref:hypothetical protein n=1 Tax=Duganella sp. LjRoot269 TaxID=3342305 RepID=UPI003ECECD4A